MRDEQKYANIVTMATDYNNDKSLILNLTQQITELKEQLALTKKALKLACNDLDDYVALCKYCPHNICAECPNTCPDSIDLLINYFKKNAKKENRHA